MVPDGTPLRGVHKSQSLFSPPKYFSSRHESRLLLHGQPHNILEPGQG